MALTERTFASGGDGTNAELMPLLRAILDAEK